jgi:hypothetical protein
MVSRRTKFAVLGALTAVGCPQAAPPKPTGKAESVTASQAPAQASDDAWPAETVPAFKPGATCAQPYALLGDVCVHGAYRSRTPQAELEQKIALYRRGAAPPFVGGPPPPAPYPPERRRELDPSKLPPDALLGAPPRAAAAAKEARLRALAEMLERVEAKRAAASRPVSPSTPKPPAAPRTPGAANVVATTPPPRAEPRAGEENLGLDAQTTAQVAELQQLIQALPEDERALVTQGLDTQALQQALGPELWQQLFSQQPQ